MFSLFHLEQGVSLGIQHIDRYWGGVAETVLDDLLISVWPWLCDADLTW